jgi:hypothetical protein
VQRGRQKRCDGICSFFRRQVCDLQLSSSLWKIPREMGIAEATAFLPDWAMKFRLRAFALHLLGSAIVLTLVLGTLYFGWYRWPGWYLADALNVGTVLAGADLTIGPLLTFVIARATKPRRELARDIAVIVVLQICALVYGTMSLWSGRPLYYAFSENVLQLVQAYDINDKELALAREQNAPLLPHWYSLPRWIWAPLPQDPKERDRIVKGVVLGGGDDVITMPRYYKPWDEGLPELRKQLKKVDDVPFFGPTDKEDLKGQMQAAGFATDQLNAMVFTGRGRPLLVVFDPQSLKIQALLHVPERPRPALKGKQHGWWPLHRK